MNLAGILLQTALFFAFMLAANYFFLQRKQKERMKISTKASALAAVLYGVFIYVWKGMAE